jgi:hypothetical protein
MVKITPYHPTQKFLIQKPVVEKYSSPSFLAAEKTNPWQQPVPPYLSIVKSKDTFIMPAWLKDAYKTKLNKSLRQKYGYFPAKVSDPSRDFATSTQKAYH